MSAIRGLAKGRAAKNLIRYVLLVEPARSIPLAYADAQMTFVRRHRRLIRVLLSCRMSYPGQYCMTDYSASALFGTTWPFFDNRNGVS